MRVPIWFAVSVTIALSGHAAIVPADESAVAPKLEDIERADSNAGADELNAAQPLPATVTICQDASKQRCWTESGATECISDASSGAKVFRRTGSNVDPGGVLADCWAALQR